MPQSKSKRSHAGGIGAAALQPKHRRRAKSTGNAERVSKQQRAEQDSVSSPTKPRDSTRVTQDESNPRRGPSEYDPDGWTVESGGRREPGGGRADEGVEELDEPAHRPGGTGDASFGDDDEGPEGPAR